MRSMCFLRSALDSVSNAACFPCGFSVEDNKELKGDICKEFSAPDSII